MGEEVGFLRRLVAVNPGSGSPLPMALRSAERRVLREIVQSNRYILGWLMTYATIFQGADPTYRDLLKIREGEGLMSRR